MTEILPPRQKQAGRSIHGFDQGIWAEAAEEKIFPGLLAKFDQNPVCKDTLIQTGDNVIIEANPYDLISTFGSMIRNLNIIDEYTENCAALWHKSYKKK